MATPASADLSAEQRKRAIEIQRELRTLRRKLAQVLGVPSGETADK